MQSIKDLVSPDFGDMLKTAGHAIDAANASAAKVTETIRASSLSLPRSTSLTMLGALQGKHVYAGTADPARVAKDRARNKVARRQRRVNRLRGARKGVR